jgi:hypothetical protein
MAAGTHREEKDGEGTQTAERNGDDVSAAM